MTEVPVYIYQASEERRCCDSATDAATTSPARLLRAYATQVEALRR